MRNFEPNPSAYKSMYRNEVSVQNNESQYHENRPRHLVSRGSNVLNNNGRNNNEIRNFNTNNLNNGNHNFNNNNHSNQNLNPRTNQSHNMTGTCFIYSIF